MNAIHDEYLIDIPFNRSEYEKMDDAELDAKLKELSLSANTQIHSDFVGKTAGGVDDIYSDYYALTIDIANSFKKLFNKDFEKFDPESQIPESKKANKDLILAKLNFDISNVDNAFLATMSPTTIGTGNVAPGVSSDNIPNKYDAGYTAIPSNIVCKNVNEDAVVINASDISYLNAYDYVGIVDDNGTVSWHALTENLAAELKASRSVKDLNIGSSKLISSGLTLNIDNNTQVLVVDPIEHSKHCNHVGCCFCSSAPKLRSEEGIYNPLRKALQLISDFCEPRQLQAKKSLAGLDKLDKQISGDRTFYQKSKFDKSMFSQDGTRINKSIFDAKCSGIRSSMQKRLHQVLTDKQNKKLGFDANGSTSESNMLAANMCQRVVLYDSEGNGRFFSLDTISSWPVENGQYVVPEGLSFSSGRVSPFTFTSLGSFIADAIDKEIEQNPNGYKGDGHINYEEVVGNALKTLDGTAGKEAISFRELEAYTPLVPDAGFTGVGYDYSSAWRNLVKAQKYIDSLTPKSEFNVKSLSQLSKKQQEEYERYKKYGQQYNIYPDNEKIAVKVFGKIDKGIDSNIGKLASEVNGNEFLKQNNLLAKNHYALVLGHTDIKEAVAWSNATGSSLLIERSMYNTLKGTNAFAGFREGFSFGDKTSFVEITPLLDENYYAGLHSGMKVSALKCDPNSDVMEIYAEQNIMGSTDSQSYLNPFAKLIKRLRQPLTGSFNISVPKETQLKTSYQTSIIKKRSDLEKFLIRDDNGNVRGLDWIKDEKNIEELVKYYQNIGVELTNNTGTLKQNQYTLASPREVARQLFVFAHRVCTEGSTDFSEDRGCLTKNIVREDCVGVIDYFHINEDGTRSHIYQPAIIQGSGPSYLTSARLDINNNGCTVTYSFTNDSVLAEKDGDATKMTNYFGAAMKALGYIVDEKFGALFPTLSFKDYASTYNENISVDILSDPYVTGSRIVTDDMRKQRMLTNFGTAQTHMGGMLFLQKDESTGRWTPRGDLGRAFKNEKGEIDMQKVIGLYTNRPYTTMKQLLKDANAANGGIVEFFDPAMDNARYYNKILTHLFLRNAKIGSDASIRGLLSSYEFELYEDQQSFQPISRRTVRPDYHSLMSKLNMNECSLFFNLLNTYDGKKICENVLTDTQRNENALFTADGRMYVEMPKYVIEDGNPTIINSQPEPVEVFWGQKNFNIERTDEMENLGETNLSYQHIYKAGWEYGYSETFADSIGYFQSSLNNWDAAWLDYEGSMQKRFVKTADGSTKEWIPQVLSDKESYDIYTDPELTLREKSHTASLRKAAKIFTTGVRIVDENNNTIPDGDTTVEEAIGRINTALGIENSSKKISRTLFQNWILPSYLGITYSKDVTPVVYLADLHKHVNTIVESIEKNGLVIPANRVDSSSKSYGTRYSVPLIPEDIARYLYSVSPALTNKHATFEEFQVAMAKEWNTQYEDIAAIQDHAKKNEILKLARYAKKTSTNPDLEVAGATEFYADTYFEDLIEADENLLKIMYKMDDAQVEFAKSELKRIQNTMKEIAKHKNSDNFNSYVDKKGKAHITYKGKNIDFVTAFCKNASALTKIMAVLNPMIAAANVTERVASQGVMNAALYAGTVGVGPYRVTNNKNYKVDGQIELVKHACTNEGAKELYASWRFLELTGYQGGMPRSRAELNALMEDHLSKQNKLQKLVNLYGILFLVKILLYLDRCKHSLISTLEDLDLLLKKVMFLLNNGLNLLVRMIQLLSLNGI